MLGNSYDFFHLLIFFSQRSFFKKFFQEINQSVKQFVGLDLGPNCLQRLSEKQNKELKADLPKKKMVAILKYPFTLK